MLNSSLFRRIFLFVLFIALGSAAALYFTAVPLIRNKVHDLETASARTILNNVYELAKVQALDIEAYRRDALQAYMNQLKNIVRIQESFVRTRLELAGRGEITMEDAKRHALEEMRGFRYGNNDYLMVFDESSRVISHPDPELHGKDYSNLTDINGTLIIKPMVEMAIQQGEGSSRYWWKRLGQEEPSEKLTYFKYIPEWNWILSTGVYVDDVAQTVAKRKKEAIEELRQILRETVIARTGYVYVFNRQYDLIIHPNPAIEGTNIRHLPNPSTRNPILDDLMEASRKPDPVLHYLWDRNEDKFHFVYPKISWVRYLEPFDWYIASSVYMDELNEGAASLQRSILMVACGMVLAAAILAWIAARRMLVPIRALSGTALRVKGGDLSARADVKGDKDLSELAGVFNATLDKVESLVADVVEERERAKDASEAKSQFLANMSHEIRTPMNAIIGNADLALRSATDTRQQRYLSIIQSSSHSLLQLINDILDFSKIEAGKLDLEMRPFSLDELLAQVADLHLSKASEKHIDFVIDIGEGVPESLVWDPLRLKQVLVNLTSNAFKFTETGSVSVAVSVLTREASSVELLFTVRDTGIGIPRDVQDKLFAPFTQADASTTRKFGGTGLGLAICKRIVKMMNGRIMVASEQDQGSEFMFTGCFTVDAWRPAPGAGMPAGLLGMDVLVVDDHPQTLSVAKRLFERLGMKAQSAVDGENALRKLDEARQAGHPFGLVITDWRLPGMSGAEAAGLMKDLPDPPKVILFTIHGREDILRLARKARVDAVLIKPLMEAALRRVVLEVFGHSRPEAPRAFDSASDSLSIAGLHVLLVEDNVTNQQMAVELLALAKVTADVAANGQEAVEALARRRYDAVLMDCQMPVMDGFEATRAIRWDLGLTSLPVIAMTANAMVGDREKCLEAGMDDYVSKPIDPKDLWAALARHAAVPGAGRDASAGAWTGPEPRENHAPRPAAPVSERMLPVVAGLDLSQAMERFMGNAQTYLRVLARFLDNTPAILEEYRRAEAAGDRQAAAMAAHSIKGSAGNVSAVDVYRVAASLERACNAGERFVMSRLFDELGSALATLSVSARTASDILAPFERGSGSPEAQPSAEDPGLDFLLGDLALSLEASDPVRAGLILDALSRNPTVGDPNGIGPGIGSIREALVVYDFTRARDLLEGIRGSMA